MFARRKSLAVTLAGVVGVGVCVASVHADATIIGDARFMEMSGDASDFDGSDTGPFQSFTPSVFAGTFNEGWGYNLDSPAFAASANTEVLQSSSLNGSTTFSALTASGQANIDGNVDFDGLSSQAFAESNFEIDFQLDAPHDYVFSGLLDTFSSGTTVRAKLIKIGVGDVFSTTADGNFDDFGQLSAGSYTLQLLARSTKFISNSTLYNSDSSFQNVQFDLTLVPEPASLALLMLGAVAVLRRNRR